MDKKEIARIIYKKLKEEGVESAILSITKVLEAEKTEKLQITKTPLLNSIGQELGRLLKKENWKFEKLKKLWKNGKREERLITISALGEIGKKEYEAVKEFVLDIIEDIPDWEICDQLALRVVVNLAKQNKEEMFSIMEKWVLSKNKWIRRLAVATIPPYIRAIPQDSKRSLTLLENVMKEEDKEVKKAVGWALREVTKKDPKSVFGFLKKWVKNNDKNTKWIIKDGMKKLTKENQDILKSLLH